MMIQDEIKRCNLPEEDKVNLEIILNNGDLEFVKQYLMEISMNAINRAVKNLPTEQICKDYESGMTDVQKIGKKYDCSIASVRNHLNKGGFVFDHNKHKYIRVNTPVLTKPRKKFGLQRKIINWLLEENRETFTVEQIAKIFGVHCDSASGALGEISKKGIGGLKRIGKGVYKVSKPNVADQNIPKHSVPVVQVDDVKLNNQDEFKKVASLAKELGINNLIDVANTLRNLAKDCT